jgi:MYXO-CTERM domain-containing protein
MMTELLLALYPEMFKAGSAFAGMPAGCRGANESAAGTGYSGACAGGSVTHTGAQWGNIVNMMDPGYTGHRPRVQLFHGSADPTISPMNLNQAIVEWTDVLGLSTNPTTTTMGVSLGNHQATRQQWKNSCGYVVLDTFLSIGGDHGPSDALFQAQYVVPFLGLDQVGAVDPEIAQCGSGGGGGGAGGASGSGGSAGTGGAMGAGGNRGLGGGRGQGGEQGSDAGSDGGTGGLAGIGGSSATGGAAGAGSGGAPSDAAAGGTPTGGVDSGSAGCSCALASNASNQSAAAVALIALALATLARRRRRGARSTGPDLTRLSNRRGGLLVSGYLTELSRRGSPRRRHRTP